MKNHRAAIDAIRAQELDRETRTAASDASDAQQAAQRDLNLLCCQQAAQRAAQRPQSPFTFSLAALLGGAA